MWKDVSRGRLIGAWCAAVIVLGAYGVVAGAALTINNGELWLLTCVVPPAVLLLVWRGGSPVTVAEPRYSVTRPSKEGRL
jgi:hypothetical protein